MLIQAQTFIDLLFKSDLCKLMTICSKLFQRFDVLPFEPYEAFQNLMKNLHQAKASFEKESVPNLVKISDPSLRQCQLTLFGSSSKIQFMKFLNPKASMALLCWFQGIMVMSPVVNFLWLQQSGIYSNGTKQAQKVHQVLV